MFQRLPQRLLAQFTAPLLPRSGLSPDFAIPFADVQMAQNPVEAIVSSPEYLSAATIFAEHPYWSDSVFSHFGVALLYALVRKFRPDIIVEVGSHKGKTAFALAHALAANGSGLLYPVDPFNRAVFGVNFPHWPQALKSRTRYQPISSAAFFAMREPATYDLVLVDGNHDYEYALFDIMAASRRLKPGGFIVIDNISQAGPARAALQFLRDSPEWQDCGPPFASDVLATAYDRNRATIKGTDLMVLRAPRTHLATRWPRTFGLIKWPSSVVAGIDTMSEEPVRVQCVLRSYSRHSPPHEAIASVEGAGRLTFTEPLCGVADAKYTAEIWISSMSDAAVSLSGLPAPF